MLHLPLAELDHGHGIDHLACVYLPPLDPLAYPRDVDSLIYLMGRLRGPGGCPWDREQSHESLRRYLIEETYETAGRDRLGRPRRSWPRNSAMCCCRSCSMPRWACRRKSSRWAMWSNHIVTKLVRRHPHVFGEVEVEGAEGVIANWDDDQGGGEAGQSRGQRQPPTRRPAWK